MVVSLVLYCHSSFFSLLIEMSLSPNDSYLYEKIIHQVQEDQEQQPSIVQKALPILMKTTVGVAAGTAVGFFFLPSISLVACGVVGGLGLYTASNAVQSFRSAWSEQSKPLTIESHSGSPCSLRDPRSGSPCSLRDPRSGSPSISSKQKD